MKILSTALILVGALLAILAPYILVSFFTGFENAVYSVIILATYLLLMHLCPSSYTYVWMGGAFALSVPISTFVYSGNAHLVFHNGLVNLVRGQELIMSIVRFAYFALFLRIARYQVIRISEQQNNSARQA